MDSLVLGRQEDKNLSTISKDYHWETETNLEKLWGTIQLN